MSGKNQFPTLLNWQSIDPSIGFTPNGNNYGGGSKPSGVSPGVMTGTNTIYSNILDVSRMDNIGIDYLWVGSAVGALSILASVSGSRFSSLTLPTSQPAGVDGKMNVSLNQFPYKFIMLKYVNASGSGVLTVDAQNKTKLAW